MTFLLQKLKITRTGDLKGAKCRLRERTAVSMCHATRDISILFYFYIILFSGFFRSRVLDVTASKKWAITFKQWTNLPPAGDSTLIGILAQRDLQQEDGDATSKQEDEVRDEESTCDCAEDSEFSVQWWPK